MKESLEHFGTISFDLKLMGQMIDFKQYDKGSIEAAYWYAIVPDVYKEKVLRIIEEVFPVVQRQKSSPELLRHFINVLHRRIWDTLEPVR